MSSSLWIGTEGIGITKAENINHKQCLLLFAAFYHITSDGKIQEFVLKYTKL
jgi:hypothetical protein